METAGHNHAIDFVLSPAQVAETLGISLKTLRRRWDEGKGPRRVRMSERRIGVRASELERYLAEISEEVAA